MSAETQDIVSTLMRDFRQLVLGLQDEHVELKQKLNSLPAPKTTTLRSSFPKSTSSHETLPTTAAPSTNGPPLSAATNTSSSLNRSTNTLTTTDTNSSRPPPYKPALRPLVPQVPYRTRRVRHVSTTTTATMSTISLGSRGALIVLEGLDRVGKSTLAMRLVEHLERTRRPVSYCRFPDRTTPIGKLINEFLQNGSKRVDDHAMHLLFSANRWEMSKRIRHTLNQGTTVIVDRYSYSGIAYSSAKAGLSIEWCREMERGLPRPDLVIYLELAKEAQYHRPGFGEERFETKELQELVRHQYELLMDMSQETWLRVDVENKSPDQVLGEIIVPVKRCLESSAHKELGTLDFV